MQELVELGISWIWMGLESPRAQYSKLQGTDTVELARELRAHGIKLLGSTIVGLEHHTPQNIEEELEHAVAHDTDFHQFMLYTPAPGTALHAQLVSEGRLLEDVDVADMHGQDKFNFRHAAISREDSKHWLDWAFRRDFECNGPSLYRVCRTTFEGWKRYKDHPDPRIRDRFKWEARSLCSVYSALLWAMEHRLKKTNSAVSGKIRALRQEMGKEFGLFSRVAACLLGPILLWTTIREENRLARGITYEPTPLLERHNWGLLEGRLVTEPVHAQPPTQNESPVLSFEV